MNWKFNSYIIIFTALVWTSKLHNRNCYRNGKFVKLFKYLKSKPFLFFEGPASEPEEETLVQKYLILFARWEPGCKKLLFGSKPRQTLSQWSLNLGNAMGIFSTHGKKMDGEGHGIPCSLDGRQVTPKIQSCPSLNEQNCTGSRFFPFQKEPFSSNSSSVALWAPKRQGRNDTTCGKMKQVNLFQNTALTDRFSERHTGKNYTCSQDGAWICYLRNINFLVENQNHPASSSQHTHNCRPVMHSDAGDRRNHSESEVCQKSGLKKSPICHFCNAARHLSPLPQYFWENKGNLCLMPKRKAFF